MRHFFSYGWLLLLLVFAGCRKEDSLWNGPGLEITVETPADPSTKAGADGTADGVVRYNENLISWVDFYFYPGEDTSSDATYHVRKISGKQRSDVIRLEMESNEVNTLIFPLSPEDVRTCTVYAVVNYPDVMIEDEDNLSGTSVPELEQRIIVSDFAGPLNHRQERFVMTGSALLKLRGRTQVVAAAATVPVTRLACKLSFAVNVSDEVTMGDEVWKPMLSGMEVYLVNGVKNVSLGGEAPSPIYFSYRGNALRFAYNDLEGGIHYYFDKDGEYYNTYPTYMYPQHWEYGATEGTEIEPYFKLVIPWQRLPDEEKGILGTQRQFYYKIMIPNDKRGGEFLKRFVSNNWYHIKVNVGMLGAETDEATVPILSGWCYIVYWQDKEVVIKNAEIGNARYLSVEQEQYQLHNLDAVSVRYTSSHPVRLKDIRVTRPYYGTANTGTDQYGGTIKLDSEGALYRAGTRYLEFSEEQRKAMNDGEDWFTDTGTSIDYSHTLVNDYTSTKFDYSPYTVTFSIVHDDRPDDATYLKTVTIVQEPGIYIVPTINEDPLTGPKGKPLHWGYVYVDAGENSEQLTLAQYDDASNEDKDTEYRYDHLWRVVNYSSGGRDIFEINVTVLPKDSEFVIGDPRTDSEDRVRTDEPYFQEAHYVGGGDNLRTLEYYYPTEQSDRTVNMIAPSYKVSTKLSGIEHGGITYAKARERCASLQENGFPAGRWRIPTKAEIRFISMLSSLGFFEWQFGGDYWSANGAVYVNKENGVVTDSGKSMETGVALLRCVYDSWYWGGDQIDNLEQFTWGDAQR